MTLSSRNDVRKFDRLLEDRMAAYSSIGKIPKMKISSLGCLTNVGVHTKHLRQQKSQVVLSTTIVSQAFRMW
jgi:hypothetical protein